MCYYERLSFWCSIFLYSFVKEAINLVICDSYQHLFLGFVASS